MSKNFSLSKTLFTLIGLILGIVILAPIGLFLLFDPNDYKTEIQDVMLKKTGYQMSMQGDIKFQFFPWIGLQVNDLQLQPQGQLSSATIQKLNLNVPLESLFQKKLQIDSVSIEGAIFNLDSAPQSQSPKPKDIKSPTKEKSPAKTQNTSQNKESLAKSLSIDKFEIIDSKLIYTDSAQSQTVEISNLNLQLQDFAPSSHSPIKCKFDYNVTQKNKKQPISGSISLHSKLKKDTGEWLAPKTKLKLDLHDKNTPLQITSELLLDFIYSPQKEITIKNLNGHINNSKTTGFLKIPLSQEPIHFNLDLDSLDLSQWQKLAQSDAQDSHLVKTRLQKSHTFSPAARGQIQINTLVYPPITARKVSMPIKIESGQLTISPLQAELYNGSLSAHLNKNMSKNAPTHIKGLFSDFNVQDLLKDVARTDKVKGQGRVEFNLTQSGKHTTGVAKTLIKQGLVQGLDLDYYYIAAGNYINKKPMPTQAATGDTEFDTLTATFYLDQHFLKNPDLNIYATDYHITGKGHLDLKQNLINYDILAVRQTTTERIKSTLPLAVKVQGSLSDPQVTPDFNRYAEMFMQQEGQRLIQKALGVDPDQPDADDAAQQKIEDEIKKGLKKLFKF